MQVMGGVFAVIRVSTLVAGLPHPGGLTRILIIDDDRKPPHPLPQGKEGVHERPENGLDAAGARTEAVEYDTRPVVHELQVPTPLPVEPGNHVVASELDDGGPDASVVRQLIARVEELLHRTRAMPAGASTGWTGTIRFGSVMLEPATQTVLRGGQPVRVTHTEFRLLLALMRRRGAIASRMELLREVWGAGAVVSRRAVDTHIARLRRKLEEDPANPRHILTALAWGYRFRP
jgi:hypothetical protein